MPRMRTLASPERALRMNSLHTASLDTGAVSRGSACYATIGAVENESRLMDELFRAMLDELMTGQLSAVQLFQTRKGHE